MSKTQSELASHSSTSPSARRPLCRSRAPAGLQLTSGGFCWSVRSCRFNATGGHVRNRHGARLVDNPHTVSCATPDASLFRAKLQRNSHICIDLPSTSLAWRDHFVLLKCSPAFGALGAHDDLQLVISSSATISSFGTCSVSTASTRWSERLRPPNDSSTVLQAPCSTRRSQDFPSACHLGWFAGLFIIPTLFGASVYLETFGAFSHRGSFSDKSQHWLMKSEPGHLDVLLDLLSGGRPRCCTSSEVAEPNKILLNL